MRPVQFDQANLILVPPVGQEDVVIPLPVCLTQNADGIEVVVSVWELSDDDLIDLNIGRKLYLTFQGNTHPPVYPTSITPFQEEVNKCDH